jgi:hypothetical protein
MVSAATIMHHPVPACERPWQVEVGRWFPVELSSLFCLLELNNLIHHPLSNDKTTGQDFCWAQSNARVVFRISQKSCMHSWTDCLMYVANGLEYPAPPHRPCSILKQC